MRRFTVTSIIVIVVVLSNLNVLFSINAQGISLYDISDEDKSSDELYDDEQSLEEFLDTEDEDLMPDFDLNQIETEYDENQILKRFRRGRSLSLSSIRFPSVRSSGSSSGSKFFGGSRSSSSGGGFRILQSGGSNHQSPKVIQSPTRKPPSWGSGVTAGLSGSGASKPSNNDGMQRIIYGGAGIGSGIGMGQISASQSGIGGTGGSGIGMKENSVSQSGIEGTGGGSGGNAWVRTAKNFLTIASRFVKQYYKQRKNNKATSAGTGVTKGYDAESQLNNEGDDSPNNYDNSVFAADTPEETAEKKITVFYCIQQDVNTTLVNKTLDKDDFGVCNISGKLVTCPIEIECKTSEADNCCENNQGTVYYCGGEIPKEYASKYGGHGYNYRGGSDALNIVTAIWIVMSTICFIIWQRRD